MKLPECDQIAVFGCSQVTSRSFQDTPLIRGVMGRDKDSGTLNSGQLHAMTQIMAVFIFWIAA
jgi:hypothetical protein